MHLDSVQSSSNPRSLIDTYTIHFKQSGCMLSCVNQHKVPMTAQNIELLKMNLALSSLKIKNMRVRSTLACVLCSFNRAWYDLIHINGNI